jgi:diketogulonate reductase-like aldo/keto reductase
MTSKHTLKQVRSTSLPSGRAVPVLGQGTWSMGEIPSKRQEELDALRLGISLGMSLIDTAEIYGNGLTEEFVAEALGSQRKEVFLVSKVAPYNASYRGTLEACERSLRRLKTDYLDLYLLHWPGSIPLQETLEAFQELRRQGKILDFGLSNFDVQGMEEAARLAGPQGIATNQVLYNLGRRGIEWDLIPWSQEKGIPLMAYTPIEQGKLLDNDILKNVAARHSATAAQIAISWILRHKDMIVIPKAGSVNHVKENHRALVIELADEDLEELDKAFPPPGRKGPLEVL